MYQTFSNKPEICLKRGNEWVFAPEEPYEKFGDVSDVVFPCGWILDEAIGVIRMYYGAADSCIALATANLSDLLRYLHHCPDPCEDCSNFLTCWLCRLWASYDC